MLTLTPAEEKIMLILWKIETAKYNRFIENCFELIPGQGQQN
jgi:hypothetical protein